MDAIDKSRLRRAVGVMLKARVGEDKNISGTDLTKTLRANGFSGYSPTALHREIRHTIREMRKGGQPVCSKAGKGYYWPKSFDEVLECADELEDKAKDMLHTGKKLKDAGAEYFDVSPQMEMFR